MPKPQPKIPLLIDTREQEGHAWAFDADRFSPISQKLDTGDYSVLGLEDKLTIERKTIGDFVSTVISNFKRFEKELQRMSGMDCCLVVIEGSLEDLYLGKYESEANPRAVVGRGIGIILDHNIPWLPASNRLTAITFAEQFIELAIKKLGGVP